VFINLLCLRIQVCTNFKKVYAPSQDSRSEVGDMKQVPYRRLIKIWFHRENLSRHSHLETATVYPYIYTYVYTYISYKLDIESFSMYKQVCVCVCVCVCV
jgi:hypothetical protein